MKREPNKNWRGADALDNALGPQEAMVGKGY